LSIASGWENGKEHRLEEPDKTKYEIYHNLKSEVSKNRNWVELIGELKKFGVKT
jgi:hypothetical protein